MHYLSEQSGQAEFYCIFGHNALPSAPAAATRCMKFAGRIKISPPLKRRNGEAGEAYILLFKTALL
jgi:hypothetical protein